MNIPSPVIAIDGPSAGGKGTIAKRLAAHYGFAHLDTGLLYRATGMAVLRAGQSLDDPEAASRAATALDPAAAARMGEDPALRSDEAGGAASKVGAVPAVRASLLKFQQDFAVQPPGGLPGAVLDGRDIGTVICPDAPVKIFVTARDEVRATRRVKELLGRGIHANEAAVLADLQARDARDRQRQTAPALPAPDAVMLDTSDMTADEAFAAALAIVEDKLKRF